MILALAAGEVSEESLTRWIRDNWPADWAQNSSQDGPLPLPSQRFALFPRADEY